MINYKKANKGFFVAIKQLKHQTFDLQFDSVKIVESLNLKKPIIVEESLN